MAHNLALLGADLPRMAAAFGVATRTWRNAVAKHPELADAVRRGKEPADGKVARSLYKNAIGYTYTEERITYIGNGEIRRDVVRMRKHPETSAQIFWLSNRQRDNWQRNGGGPGVQVRAATKTDNAGNTTQAVELTIDAETAALAGVTVPPAQQALIKASG